MVLKLSRDAQDTFLPLLKAPGGVSLQALPNSRKAIFCGTLEDVILPAKSNVKEIFSLGKDSHKQPLFS